MELVDAVSRALELVNDGSASDAARVIDDGHRHESRVYKKRQMSIYQRFQIFLSDGFIDRYSGQRLVFPNVLRALSHELGETFPYHPNWRMADCHIAYWELWPTYNHVIPIARGGEDTPDNVVTTSMRLNAVKSHWTLEETGLALHRPGSLKEWDGLIGWYESYLASRGPLNLDYSTREWDKALLRWRSEPPSVALECDNRSGM